MYICSASYSADLNGHAIRDACEKLNKKLDVIKGIVQYRKGTQFIVSVLVTFTRKALF